MESASGCTARGLRPCSWSSVDFVQQPGLRPLRVVSTWLHLFLVLRGRIGFLLGCIERFRRCHRRDSNPHTPSGAQVLSLPCMPNSTTVTWYRRSDSNGHCARSKRAASCQLGYVGMGAGREDRFGTDGVQLAGRSPWRTTERSEVATRPLLLVEQTRSPDRFPACAGSRSWTPRPSRRSRWRDLNAHLSVPGRGLYQVELHPGGSLRAAFGRARGPSWTSSSKLDSVHYGSGGRIRTFVQRFKAARPARLDDSGSPSSLRTELNCLGQAYEARLPPRIAAVAEA